MRPVPMTSAVLAALILSAGAAEAQTTSPTQSAPPPGSSTAIPEKVAPPQNGVVGPAPGESLSDHLDDTGGVLSPKGNPDPGITARPPDPNPGTTIVIPPPGTPGGDQSVQPK